MNVLKVILYLKINVFNVLFYAPNAHFYQTKNYQFALNAMIQELCRRLQILQSVNVKNNIIPMVILVMLARLFVNHVMAVQIKIVSFVQMKLK